MTWGHAVHTFLSMRHVLLRPDTHLPNEAEKRKRFLLASPPKKRRDFEKIRLGCGIVWGCNVYCISLGTMAVHHMIPCQPTK